MSNKDRVGKNYRLHVQIVILCLTYIFYVVKIDSVSEKTIGKEFSLLELIKFALPGICTQFFMTMLQTIDDGLFLSRYVGNEALSAFSLCMPWFLFVNAMSNLFCNTPSYCSKLMGENKNDEADKVFSKIVLITLTTGFIFMLLVVFGLDGIFKVLKMTASLRGYGENYMRVSCFNMPLLFLNSTLCSYYMVAGKSKLTIASSLIQTLCNFFCDWLFMVKLNIGIAGAGYANLISQACLFIFNIYVFLFSNPEIHLVKSDVSVKLCIEKIWNYGKSSFFTLVALAVNSYITNMVLLDMQDESLLAAWTIVNNIQFMFLSTFFGLFSATTPIIGYAYGEKNKKKLRKILIQTVVLTSGLSAIVICLYLLGNDLTASLYVGQSQQEYKELLKNGLLLGCFGYLFVGYNIMVQECGNALGEHRISTILTIFENVICANGAIIIMGKLFDVNGVWLSFGVCEAVAFLLTIYYVIKYQNVYGYGKTKIATFVDKNN